ncbi:hypothetical protein Slin15195_G097360 [Septoria linicola]|uniref:Apple domain-containing protein n=1 Tax=Septoria linicola TaxID=215465 RepID=A0A9Q9ENA8_9PEZI|nr:hypothetical protein Slin15195_G097360 [Septoria linicola]
MVPSTLYSLSFLIGLSAAAPAADYGYPVSSSKCTTTTHTPTTTCTAEAGKYTQPASYPSSKGGYHSADPYQPEESSKAGYPYQTSKAGYPYETSKAGYPYETTSAGYPTYTSSYYGGGNQTSITYSTYPTIDPFPTTTDEPTTTEDPFPEPTITDEPTITEDPFPEPTDEPTTTEDPFPEPTDVPEPTGETIIAPGPLGGDVTFGLDRGQSIEGSVFDQSEVPQQVIDDGVSVDFCAGACAVSSYICEGFELFTNEFDVLVCTLKFDLGGLTPSDGSISGTIIAGTDATGGAQDGNTDDGADAGTDDGEIVDGGEIIDDGTVDA